jgi:hypothetical protein
MLITRSQNTLRIINETATTAEATKPTISNQFICFCSPCWDCLTPFIIPPLAARVAAVSWQSNLYKLLVDAGGKICHTVDTIFSCHFNARGGDVKNV